MITGLAIAMVSGAAAALLGIWVWKFAQRWRRQDPAEIERLRRQSVNACGRISTGKVLELLDPAADGPRGPVLLYEYEVAGVTYQAAQDVSPLPDVAGAAAFLPGQVANVKYDPRQPTNSILACEAWCGIFDLTRSRSAPEAATTPASDAKAVEQENVEEEKGGLERSPGEPLSS